MNWRARIEQAMPSPTGDWSRDAEVLDELAAYAADRYEELVRTGHTEAEAVSIVLREVAETARRQTSRPGAWRDQPVAPRRVLAGARQDIAYAIRMLGRAPAFTLASVLTLALAIGAVTAIFTVVEAVLLRPLPYPNADRLVMVWETSPQGAARNVVSSGSYLDWRARATVFEELGALTQSGDTAVTSPGEPRRATSVTMTPEALVVVGVRPIAGRLFRPDDTIANAPRVVLLGFRAWRDDFGGDPAAVGRQITVSGRAYEIVGVLPADTVVPGADADLILPLRFTETAADERTAHNYLVVGRLKPGVTRDAANVAMRQLVAAMTVEHPKDLTGWSVLVAPLHGDLVRSVRPMLTLVFAVVIVVLLIACANLANVQLARASTRRAEMAVRAAIGAGRGRLISQLLHESVVIVGIGGALGVGLAFVLMRALVAAAPADIPFLESVAINARVLGAAMLTTMVSAVLVGVLPALQISRADLRPLMHGGRAPGDARQARSRFVLVTVQVALALVLLVAAALVVRSMQNLGRVQPGFDPERLLTIELNLPSAAYPDMSAQARFYDDLIGRVRSRPGVVAAAGTTSLPGTGSGMTFSFGIEGRVAANPTGREDPQPLQAVTAGYFETMRIPVVEGRTFTDGDRADSEPVVILNAALARRHWPGESPIGRRLTFRPGQTPWLTVVGVVGNTHDSGLDHEAPPTLYVPFAQRPPTWRWMTWLNVIVRGTSDQAPLASEVRGIVREMDRNLPLLSVTTVRDLYAANAARRRFAMTLLAGFAVLAVTLGAIGIYGVLSIGVAERQREIGVRLALGARAADVVRSVARPVVVCLAVGIAIGLAVSVTVTRFLETLLFQVAPTDPASFLAVIAVLTAVAALAAWLPVRRALRLDPVRVLRD